MATISELLDTARQHYQQGNIAQAENFCRHILQTYPNHTQTLHLLGILTQERGAAEEAIAAFYQVLELQPDLADASDRLADLLRRQGRAAEIHTLEAWLALQGGIRLQRLGRFDEAVASYRRVLDIFPHCVEAHNNLGNTLRIQGNYRAATAAYEDAIRLKPDSAEAHFNLGYLFAERNMLEQAAACFGKAIALKPILAEAHAGLAGILCEQNNTSEAVLELQTALRLQPTNRLRAVLATRLPVLYHSVAELQTWRERLLKEIGLLHAEGIVVDVTEESAPNLFLLAYQGLNDRDIQRLAARLYLAPQPSLRSASLAGNEKIRVGLLSSHFYEHTIGHWMRGIVAQLTRSDFSVAVFSVGRHDDAVAGFFKHHADRFVEVPRDLPTARRLIVEKNLDLLLHADIGMDPFTYTLAMSRLAPVQCATFGHPVTTGIETIDYYISAEALETQDADEHYTEKLVRLPTMPVYYYRTGTIPSKKEKRDFGLAEEDHGYACLQTLCKFHPDYDEWLGAILRGDPRGLLLLSAGTVPQLQLQLRKRFELTLPDVVDRIRFLPMLDYRDYLRLLALSNVQLDPTPFGGGNTSYDGLSVGTPIVTLPSKQLRGRITFALYKQMDMLDCVAGSRQEYVELALRLGTDRGFRQTIHEKILARNGAVFENSAGIRDLERFFRQAVQR
ncbi:MAG TPA: tetratricopeptide repeat protein [Gemmataceae bacterium]|nr:tetratricopeptide repeat protein [Gemmataceae bacterium]